MRYFDSADSILPDKSAPTPASIRSYAESLPPKWLGSTPPPAADGTTRSILKRKQHIIRLAKSVEEGTLNNREAARLLVTGRRPGLTARDSFQLAMLRKGTDELSIKQTQQHGDMPGSDDSAASDERDHQAGSGGNKRKSPAGSVDASDEEEEEEIEQDGALATASLVSIIINGAEDLLTLEEAYKTLVTRLKSRIPLSTDQVTDVSAHDIEIIVRPISEDASAMVRALQRDINRLLGKVPNSELVLTPDRDSSLFAGLMPLHDSTPVNSKTHPASPPLTAALVRPKSPTGATTPMRQGYTEAEVRYRREAAGVGSAAMNFLALALHTRHIFSCFTDADIQSLLDLILVIPRSPQLPTPNPKRTHHSTVSVLSNMRVPLVCVAPLKDKLAKALEIMTNENYGSPGNPIKDSNFRKEVYSAIVNVLTSYPATFFPYTAELLAPSLTALSSPTLSIRNRAAAAVVAYAAAKYNVQHLAMERVLEERTPAAKAEWIRVRTAVSKSEIFFTNYLKRPRTLPGMTGIAYGPDGQKRTEWSFLEKLLKDRMVSEPHLICGLWAALISLIGSYYTTCGLSAHFDHIMDVSLVYTRAVAGYPVTDSPLALAADLAQHHAPHPRARRMVARYSRVPVGRLGSVNQRRLPADSELQAVCILCKPRLDEPSAAHDAPGQHCFRSGLCGRQLLSLVRPQCSLCRRAPMPVGPQRDHQAGSRLDDLRRGHGDDRIRLCRRCPIA